MISQLPDKLAVISKPPLRPQILDQFPHLTRGAQQRWLVPRHQRQVRNAHRLALIQRMGRFMAPRPVVMAGIALTPPFALFSRSFRHATASKFPTYTVPSPLPVGRALLPDTPYGPARLPK